MLMMDHPAVVAADAVDYAAAVVVVAVVVAAGVAAVVAAVVVVEAPGPPGPFRTVRLLN